MREKTKNIIITIGFVLILMVVFFLNLLTKDNLYSDAERRKLQQFPEITFNKIKNMSFMNEFDTYAVEQFVSRDTFRSIKSFVSINLLKNKDNNDLFEKDGAIYKMEYPLNENNVNKSLDKINFVYNKYLKGMNVYFSLIPDKNYYLENDDHLKLDYARLKELIDSKLGYMNYIDITNDLELNDYYTTDLHWKQQNLGRVVSKLEKGMNLKDTTKINYTSLDMGEYYGTYYGQYGMKLNPDQFIILTNDAIDNAKVYNFETNKYTNVYEDKKTMDRYDIYLSGATPLISVENPKAKTKKELILFRDSFGSSLAPLLLENYSKITLIDIRYISSAMLGDFIDFNNQDVLFMYSSLILNQNVFR